MFTELAWGLITMKETPIFEEVFSRLLGMPGFWLKVLAGSLLCFIPVVNFFAFGYLLRLSREIKRSGRVALPEWDNWPELFVDGLKFSVVWLVYWLVPILLAWAVSVLIGLISLGALSYLLVSLVFMLSSILFSAALYRYNRRADFKDLLNLPLILRMSLGAISKFITPALVFVGIFAVAAPLYGFALFFSFITLIAYSTLFFRGIEQQQKVAP